MKTVMQEVYENFNTMSDADFKSWMLNTNLLEEEKKQIVEAANNGCTGEGSICYIDSPRTGEAYYNENYGSDER